MIYAKVLQIYHPTKNIINFQFHIKTYYNLKVEWLVLSEIEILIFKKCGMLKVYVVVV